MKLEQLRDWALFSAPWVPVIRALGWPSRWLEKHQLLAIIDGGDERSATHLPHQDHQARSGRQAPQ